VGLANDLLKNFEPKIEELTLVPSDGGKFEVSVDGKLAFSKIQVNRHANAGEVVDLVKSML
jgi:selenoprotein W-related protein